jgi:predicted nucleic acid-binding protein
VPILFWDASALAKRYVPEPGYDTVDVLLQLAGVAAKILATLGYAEVYSIILRKRNRGEIQSATLTTAHTLLRSEVVESGSFTLFPIDDAAVFASLPLMDSYNLNATDASLLALVLRYRDSLPPGSPNCVLIAADQRFLTAAQAEGLATLNPETVAAADVPAFLASL